MEHWQQNTLPPPSVTPAGPPQVHVQAIKRWPPAIRLFLIVGLSASCWTGIVYAVRAFF